MIPNRTRPVAALALFLVVALGAAACGASSDGAVAPTTDPSRTTIRTTVETTVPVTTVGATTTASSIEPAGASGGAGTVTTIVVKPAVATVRGATDASLRTPDGRTRTYHVYVPSHLGTGRVPLLVALHGGTGWGKQFEKNSGFDGLAEANRFIVVYPDGVGIGANGDTLRTWNGGGCCGPAVSQQVDDVAFIRLLITTLEGQYRIDPARVFAAGHSNGGILAYRLACQLADQIVAIGVQSSPLEVDGCRPSQPVSVVQIHGSADQNVPIGGGKGPNGISQVAFNRPIDGAITLAAADGCPKDPARSVDAANRDLTISAWSPCRRRTEVTFIQVQGATHAWMGHPTGGSGKVGAVYPDLDSSLQIWNFLSQHPRRA